jgi:hypothetical protein
VRYLTLTDGTTTVTLSTTTKPEILKYQPQAPGFDITSAPYADADGGDQPRALMRNVTEPAVISYGDSVTARAELKRVNNLLWMARDRQISDAGARVYVKYQAADSDTLLRAELLSGWAELSNAAGTELTINWTRRFWEYDTEVQVGLTNDAGDAGTQLTIYSQYNPGGGKVNMVRIPAANLPGDIPYPARIEIRNNYTSDFVDVLVGHQVDRGLGLSPRLELESQPGGYGVQNGSTVVTTAGYSGSGYVNLNVASTSEVLAWTGELGTALLNACNGEWYSLIAYMGTGVGPSDLYIRARVSLFGITPLWEGEYVPVPVNASAINLGALQLPAAISGLVGAAPLTLELRVKRDSAGAANIPIDFVIVTPARQMRHLRPIGYNTPVNYSLVDDQISRAVYIDGGVGARLPNYVGLGSTIMLTPNAANTLWFAINPTSNILRTAQVKVFVRPRRMTL